MWSFYGLICGYKNQDCLSLFIINIMSFYFSMPDFDPYEGCEGEWVAATNFFGRNKSFGYFGCSKCEKTWMSAHARKGFKQGCKECDRYYYPLYLWENKVKVYKKKDKTLGDNGKPHLSHLCEACKKGVCEMANVSKKYFF